MTKQKLNLERTLSDLGKPFQKKSDQKIKKTEKQCQNAAYEQKTTTTSEKGKNWFKKKLGLESTMNGLAKPFGKKSDPKNRKQ